MKFQKILLAALLAGFATVASAEQGYVGAGNGGPLFSSTGGCVMSVNDTQFKECGGAVKKEEPKKPKVIIKVIKDCSKCIGKRPKKPQ